jgi:hypothetical protein
MVLLVKLPRSFLHPKAEQARWFLEWGHFGLPHGLGYRAVILVAVDP